MEDEDELFNEKEFFLSLLGIGIHDYNEHIKLLQTAKYCALTAGKNQAVIGAGIGFVAGTATVIGEVPGAVAGALLGMYHGTKSCMHAQEIQEVRIFADSQ